MTYLCLERSERNGEKHERTYRVVTEQKITEYTATVNVMTTKPAQKSGSYLKFPVLFYPGQYEIYEDNGTRKERLLCWSG